MIVALALVQQVAVQAQGSAPLGKAPAAARKQALDDAIRQAVEQAIGGVLDEATRKKHDRVIARRVLRSPGRFVPIYRVLDERTVTDGEPHIEVMIEAQVSTRALAKELADLAPTDAPPVATRPSLELSGDATPALRSLLSNHGFAIADRGRGGLAAQVTLQTERVGPARGAGGVVVRATARAALRQGEGSAGELAASAMHWGRDPGEVNRAASARAVARLGETLVRELALRFPARTVATGQVVLEGAWEWGDLVALRTAISAGATRDAVPLSMQQGRLVLSMPAGVSAKQAAEAVSHGSYPPGHSLKVAHVDAGEVRIKLERSFDGDGATTPQTPPTPQSPAR